MDSDTDIDNDHFNVRRREARRVLTNIDVDLEVLTLKKKKQIFEILFFFKKKMEQAAILKEADIEFQSSLDGESNLFTFTNCLFLKF